MSWFSLRQILLCLLAVAATPTIAAADSGTLLVLNKSDNTVSLINVATKTAVATIPTGAGPHEVAVSPNGKIAVVANYGTQQAPGSSLTVIDVAGRSRLRQSTSASIGGRTALNGCAEMKSWSRLKGTRLS